jgi:hypothetical protein
MELTTYSATSFLKSGVSTQIYCRKVYKAPLERGNKMKLHETYVMQPSVRPVSEGFVERSETVNDTTWEIMKLIRGPYQAYNANFIKNGRPVVRSDFDEVQVEQLHVLHSMVVQQFGGGSNSDYEHARAAVSRLADGYSMNEADVAHFEKMQNELQTNQLPVGPNRQATGRLAYIHNMAKLALFKRGNIFVGNIAKNMLGAAHYITGKGLVEKLYEGEDIGENAELRVFTDLVTLATAPFDESMPILQRIPYHEGVFKRTVGSLTSANPLDEPKNLSHYIDRASGLTPEQMPAKINPEILFQQRGK